ncbi:MAG: molybdate ABC transporter substrate-binding protein [Fusobacteriota bacterium]
MKNNVNLILILIFLLIIFSGFFGNNKSITLFSAASLTEVMNEMKDEFKKEYPEYDINISYAGSNTLAQQIKEGAKFDIYFSANKKYANELFKLGLTKNSNKFVSNRLIIAVPKKNMKVKNLYDLGNSDINIAVAGNNVPVGRYTKLMLERVASDKDYGKPFLKKVNKNIVSKDVDVKSVVSKLELNVVDAGIIYKTDINQYNNDKLREIKIDDKYNIKAEYFYGISSKTDKTDITDAFSKFIFSKKGKEVFLKYKFY